MAQNLFEDHITQRDRDYYIVFPNDEVTLGMQQGFRYHTKDTARTATGPVGTVRDMWKWINEVGDGYWSITHIRCSKEDEKIQRMFDRPKPIAFLFTDRETAYNFRFRYGDQIAPNPVKVAF